jgi:hypothetical protein
MNSLPQRSISFRWHDHLSALCWIALLYGRPQQFRSHLLTFSVHQQLVTALWLLLHSAPYVFVLSAASYLLRISLSGSQLQIEYLAILIASVIAFGTIGGIGLGTVLGIGQTQLGAANAIPSGIAFGIATAITGAIFFGIHEGIGGDITIASGIYIGFGFGIVMGISGGVISGSGLGIGDGIITGITCVMMSVIIFGLDAAAVSTAAILRFFTGGIASAIAVGIVSGVAGAISVTRTYYQLIHPLFVWPRLHGHWYPRHPVAWDDLCGVPFPWLDLLLVDYAEKVPESGLAEIERLISSYPSQRMMALRARVRLLARQAGKTSNLGILEEMVSALPKGEKGFLAQTGQLSAAVHEIATLQSQLDAIDRAALREPLAQLLCQEIENFRRRIGGFEEPLATEFRTAADQWLKIAEKQLRKAQEGAGK